LKFSITRVVKLSENVELFGFLNFWNFHFLPAQR